MGIVLSETDYTDRVYACWLGKNIGGTLGAPHECKKEVLNLTYFDPVPTEAAANDDLDLQLVWLKLLEDKGPDPALQDFAEYWSRYAASYPWNEYGFAHRNLARGLLPPVSGLFENYYIDEMGSPIRSEIWACVAPGDPQLAAALAWKDSQVDHAGGEGTYGEMFWAALESAAFVISDPMTLIQIGLGMIPHGCQISRAVREAVWCWENSVPWAEARERVVRNFGHFQPCHAPQNHAFTVIGWLYGSDFGDKLCKAVNCGYDTDCTGATLGALLGILGGTAGIPAEWRAPVGEAIVLHPYTRGLDAPKTVAELTERTVAVAKRVIAERSDVVKIGRKRRVPRDVAALLSRNERALGALARDVQAATVRADGLDITLHYNGEPVLRPGIPKVLGVSVERREKPVRAKIGLKVPDNWCVKRLRPALGQTRFLIQAADVLDRNQVEVSVTTNREHRTVSFVILGPEEAKGYPAGVNVPTCAKCHARVEACICPQE
ncbi:MAG: ADP-ribosylglycohydrolase family protein [Armatimonadetes bacterium]|nr:ADP-ribosylglycohydrolase family protein [Armatimonadota bacterium]